MNFKLSKDVEKNPGPTQYNTDHHEVIIRPFMQNHGLTMQLTSPISSENLIQSRLGELTLLAEAFPLCFSALYCHSLRGFGCSRFVLIVS